MKSKMKRKQSIKQEWELKATGCNAVSFVAKK